MLEEQVLRQEYGVGTPCLYSVLRHNTGAPHHAEYYRHTERSLDREKRHSAQRESELAWSGLACLLAGGLADSNHLGDDKHSPLHGQRQDKVEPVSLVIGWTQAGRPGLDFGPAPPSVCTEWARLLLSARLLMC